MSCCKKFILGKSLPKTAKELMQSRFVAFVKNKPEYLVSTATDGLMRDNDKDLIIDLDIKWKKLEIHQVFKGTENDDYGEVVFTAYYGYRFGKGSTKTHAMKEHSCFKKVNGKWLYSGKICAEGSGKD